MAEYLEKTAVIKAIHNEIYSGGKWSGGWYEIPEEEAEKNFTKRINAITPVTREQGEWIDNTDLGYHVSICSCCGWRGHGDAKLIYKPNYCPNCGADMRGDE